VKDAAISELIITITAVRALTLV